MTVHFEGQQNNGFEEIIIQPAPPTPRLNQLRTRSENSLENVGTREIFIHLARIMILGMVLQRLASMVMVRCCFFRCETYQNLCHAGTLLLALRARSPRIELPRQHPHVRETLMRLRTTKNT